MVKVEFYGGPADGLVRHINEITDRYCVSRNPHNGYDFGGMFIYRLVVKPNKIRYDYVEEL